MATRPGFGAREGRRPRWWRRSACIFYFFWVGSFFSLEEEEVEKKKPPRLLFLSLSFVSHGNPLSIAPRSPCFYLFNAPGPSEESARPAGLEEGGRVLFLVKQ